MLDVLLSYLILAKSPQVIELPPKTATPCVSWSGDVQKGKSYVFRFDVPEGIEHLVVRKASLGIYSIAVPDKETLYGDDAYEYSDIDPLNPGYVFFKSSENGRHNIQYEANTSGQETIELCMF
jgi:hypothetical protein